MWRSVVIGMGALLIGSTAVANTAAAKCQAVLPPSIFINNFSQNYNVRVCDSDGHCFFNRNPIYNIPSQSLCLPKEGKKQGLTVTLMTNVIESKSKPVVTFQCVFPTNPVDGFQAFDFYKKGDSYLLEYNADQQAHVKDAVCTQVS